MDAKKAQTLFKSLAQVAYFKAKEMASARANLPQATLMALRNQKRSLVKNLVSANLTTQSGNMIYPPPPLHKIRRWVYLFDFDHIKYPETVSVCDVDTKVSEFLNAQSAQTLKAGCCNFTLSDGSRGPVRKDLKLMLENINFEAYDACGMPQLSDYFNANLAYSSMKKINDLPPSEVGYLLGAGDSDFAAVALTARMKGFYVATMGYPDVSANEIKDSSIAHQFIDFTQFF